MKILDIEKFGNVLKFYLGDDDLKYWYGDDWNDAPYEHNSGTVYDKFVSYVVDIPIKTKYSIAAPHEDYIHNGNSPFCKYDFKINPFLVIGEETSWDFRYSEEIDKDHNIQITFGDSYEETLKKLEPYIIKDITLEKEF